MSVPILAIAGPTASGKTALALSLAKDFPIEIVNADSLQVFRHLDIGTAKPSPADLALVPHHLVNLLNPDKNLNAFEYAKLARRAIDEIRGRGRIPVVVGGAGFYLRAIESPPPFEEVPSEGTLDDLDSARRLIDAQDPALWNFIHRNDAYRISRAARQILAGESPSQLRLKKPSSESAYPLHFLIPNHDRETLYHRIGRRTDDMIQAGLVLETERVLADFPDALPRLAKAIGYRESLLFLRNEISKEDMRTLIQKNTRHYAKRQLTWFRGQSAAQWAPPSQIEALAREYLKRSA